MKEEEQAPRIPGGSMGWFPGRAGPRRRARALRCRRGPGAAAGRGGTGRRRGGTRGPAGGEGRFGCRQGGSSQVIRRKPPEILFSQGRDIPPPPPPLLAEARFPGFCTPPSPPRYRIAELPAAVGAGRGRGDTHGTPVPTGGGHDLGTFAVPGLRERCPWIPSPVLILRCAAGGQRISCCGF